MDAFKGIPDANSNHTQLDLRLHDECFQHSCKYYIRQWLPTPFFIRFIAQVYGIQLSLMQQLAIMATLMLSSKGVAAVPGASLVILTGTLTAFSLPVEGVALILGVDRLLDMARTSVNLLGNCLATAVVARWEKAFDDGQMRTALAGEAEALPEPAV